MTQRDPAGATGRSDVDGLGEAVGLGVSVALVVEDVVAVGPAEPPLQAVRDRASPHASAAATRPVRWAAPPPLPGHVIDPSAVVSRCSAART